MSSDPFLRPAEAHDAPEIAPLILMAGGGVYEFLLGGLVPGAETVDMLVPGIAGRSGSFSHRQMVVAESAGRVIGVAHAHPTHWMRDADRSFIPADRIAHLAAFDSTQDWDSYFLSALAIAPDLRRQGLARHLLARVYDRARDGGYDRVTLHVWADNAAARALYAAEGFTEAAAAAIPWHPRLPHRGGSLLLRRPVPAA
ncbi:GNAT family N-acetyltransferase [Azospirillum halopraeferens]|uniref:GNAT family N-acetyltransferase n=1 Tax=Azospirillum halopraeferens TaxID=34010 RepID=UPI00041E0844|nr:GNAT family N-acetyltransferase [Azospirillum halopraeferens]